MIFLQGLFIPGRKVYEQELVMYVSNAIPDEPNELNSNELVIFQTIGVKPAEVFLLPILFFPLFLFPFFFFCVNDETLKCNADNRASNG